MERDTPLAAPAGSVPSCGAPALAQDARTLLSGVPFLSGVASRTIDAMATQSLVHRVPAGVMIFDQAETPAFASFLIRGRVELLGVRDNTEMLIELVSPIDMLLPAAVLTQRPYLLRARALDEAHLLLIQAGAFRVAVATDHALCMALLSLQAAHFRRQVKQAKSIRLRSAEERIAAYLLRLAEAAGSKPVKLPMEKMLIASQLGVKRETFSRVLQHLARHGILVVGNNVTIIDPLAAQARFPLDPLIDEAEAVVPLAVASPTRRTRSIRKKPSDR